MATLANTFRRGLSRDNGSGRSARNPFKRQPITDPTYPYDAGYLTNIRAVTLGPPTSSQDRAASAEIRQNALNAGTPGQAGFEDVQLLSDYTGIPLREARRSYEDLDPRLRPWILADLRNQKRAEEDRIQRQQEAVGTLRSGQQRGEELLQGYQDNPQRALIESELARRAAPGYEAITGQDVQASRNNLQQSIAREVMRQEAVSASAGNTLSGANTERQGAIRAAGAGQGARLTQEASAFNEQSRTQALGLLDDFISRGTAVETDIMDQLSTIDARIAAIESGSPIQDSDYAAIGQLNFALDQFNSENDQFDRALQASIDAGEVQWSDILLDVLDIIGPGKIIKGLGAGLDWLTGQGGEGSKSGFTLAHQPGHGLF